MGLDTVTITNYRGIKLPLSVSLAPITLIGGRNNSGKSTILEAVRLLAGRRDGSISAGVNAASRKMAPGIDGSLQSLFYNEKEALKVVATMGAKKTSTVSIELRKSDAGEISSSDVSDLSLVKSAEWELVQNGSDTDDEGRLSKWTVKLTPHLGKDGSMTFSYTKKEEDPALGWKCIFHSASSRGEPAVYDYFSEMTVALQDREISAVINRIYPEIYTVKLVNSQLMVKVRGVEKLLPAKIAGDGVVRMIAVLSSMWKCSGGTLCVDEIDNGLHYSVLKDFWYAVVDFSKRFNVQVIATTHHLELLETLSKVVAETGDYEMAEYVRISNTEAGHSVSVFGGKDLERALKLGFELRG